MSFTAQFRFPDKSIFTQNLKGQSHYDEILAKCKSRETRGLLFGTVCVIRTDLLRSFLIDFTLPTLFNHALGVESLAWRVFAILGAICLDGTTFLVRVATLLPRYFLNNQQPRNAHPLYQYLIEAGAKVVGNERVVVDLVRPNDSQGIIKRINFIEIPSYR
jgi:hypothetical protein